MTYETFKAKLLAELTGHFPPDTSITIHPIPRNNHIETDGLTILESGFNITPTIYIQEYYEKLAQGLSFPEIFQQILAVYYKYRPVENIDASFFSDFSFVQTHVVYRLVHYERNRELLNQIPHIPFLDLAIIFYCLLSAEPTKNASILIKNNHMDFWETDAQTLYRLARKNTPFLMQHRCEPLSKLLFDSSSSKAVSQGKSGIDLPRPSEAPAPCSLYVLTNEQRFYGAACLLYEELLFDLSQKLQKDFYVIPSSIHEVLLIPATLGMDRDFFNSMIREVNATHLVPEEILSDHVYYYSRQERQLSV